MAFTDNQRAILREFIRRNKPNLLAGLFKQQNLVIRDPKTRKVVVTSRRAGKTWAIVRYLTDTCQNTPNALCVYVCDTRDHAKKLVWDQILKLNTDLGLGIVPNHSELTAKFPNGSRLWLAGVADEQAKERLRGHAFHLVCIDEAQSIPDRIIKPLMREIIGPGLKDHGGTLLVTGTPNAACQGFFHDISEDPKMTWSVHKWTVLDNRKFPIWTGKKDWQELAEEALEAWRIEDGFEPDDPEFLREYKGLWVRSEDDYIYRLHDDRVLIEKEDIPEDLVYVLGIDMGFYDNSAYVMLGYDQTEQIAYHVDDFTASGLSLTDIIDKANEFIEKYNPERVVIDPAAGGMHLVEEIRARYDLGCDAADKSKKAAFYKLLRADFRRSRAKVIRGSKLYSQLKSLRWDKKFKRELEGIECDLADAFLYAWRDCLHYYYLPAEIEMSLEDKMWKEIEDRYKAKMEADQLVEGAFDGTIY